MDTAAVSPKLRRFSASRNAAAPAHLGQRYDESGTFLPEPGNTVVCHLVPGSETERALIDARLRYQYMPEASLLAFTPTSSLHMTLFQGVIEFRRRPGYWPPGMDLDMPIAETTKQLLSALDAFKGAPPFRMQVTEALPTGLTLEGAGPEDRAALKAWRDKLADIFGYRHPDHEDYIFHITFAYPLTWFDEACLPAWQVMLDEVVDDIRQRAPVIELQPPAFCSFEDMNHFEELRVLPFER